MFIRIAVSLVLFFLASCSSNRKDIKNAKSNKKLSQQTRPFNCDDEYKMIEEKLTGGGRDAIILSEYRTKCVKEEHAFNDKLNKVFQEELNKCGSSYYMQEGTMWISARHLCITRVERLFRPTENLNSRVGELNKIISDEYSLYNKRKTPEFYFSEKHIKQIRPLKYNYKGKILELVPDALNNGLDPDQDDYKVGSYNIRFGDSFIYGPSLNLEVDSQGGSISVLEDFLIFKIGHSKRGCHHFIVNLREMESQIANVCGESNYQVKNKNLIIDGEQCDGHSCQSYKCSKAKDQYRCELGEWIENKQ